MKSAKLEKIYKCNYSIFAPLLSVIVLNQFKYFNLDRFFYYFHRLRGLVVAQVITIEFCGVCFKRIKCKYNIYQ